MDFTFFLSYAGGSVIFLLVLFAGEFLFSLNYKRKENFTVRALICVISVIAVSIALTIPYYIAEQLCDNEIYVNVAVIVLYLIMFVLTVATQKLCYNESLVNCILSGLAGYACQNIYFSLYSAINTGTGFEGLIYSSIHLSSVSAVFTVGYLLTALIQLAFSALVLAVVYFLVAKKTNKIAPIGFARKNIIFLTGSTLITVLIFNSFCDIYAAGNKSATIFGKCLIVVCCIFILVFYYNMLEAGVYKNDLDIVTNLNKSEHRHFEQLREDMELISVKCHDIKHFIQSNGKRTEIDTTELNELVNIYDSTIKTGNEVIDTMISERSLYCSAHGIRLTVIADASALNFISVTDMCSLFGNMLENAIEAVDKVCDEEKRIININIRPIAGQVFFYVENGCEGQPEIIDGLPVSTKEDEKNHGFGMKSIKIITEKYDGNFSCSAENGIFRVSVLFPIKINNN